ncbi:MAG: response regulator transcription factor, partial [Planctomycetaceae bacterium]
MSQQAPADCTLRENSAKVRRIMIVDDHPVVRDGLAMLISQEPDLEVCAQAESISETLKLLGSTRPDLIIVDVSLTDGSGLELVKEINVRDESARMLVSSMHDETLFAERALRAGARGYINKAEPTGTLLDAIRQVLDGRVYLSPEMTERILTRAVGAQEDWKRSPIDKLSDRELETFQLIGQGQTTRQIGQKLQVSPETIESYRENIKQKLNLQNANELTRYA